MFINRKSYKDQHLKSLIIIKWSSEFSRASVIQFIVKISKEELSVSAQKNSNKLLSNKILNFIKDIFIKLITGVIVTLVTSKAQDIIYYLELIYNTFTSNI